ncbi:inositol monophosphatase family protein [Aureliella helgolandensis]|nr:inositol monophosphatase family protein [Aureliella helgolandensis]
MQTTMEAACEAARAGGKILREQLGRAAVREKGPADLVTDADIASQHAIEQILTARFPHFAFLGEESTEQDRQAARDSGKPLWVVDPLDGTANFVHRLLSFSVSIALVEQDQTRVGVVYDPMLDVLYAAEAGGRVTKNGKPIRVSGCQQIDKAMVCCSFRPGVNREDPEVENFLRILERSQSLRRLGSAALNLCYVGEGCLDSYWATSVKAWDVAAGYLIAQTAGATLSQMDGSAFDLWNPKFVASGSPELQKIMLGCMY